MYHKVTTTITGIDDFQVNQHGLFCIEKGSQQAWIKRLSKYDLVEFKQISSSEEEHGITMLFFTEDVIWANDFHSGALLFNQQVQFIRKAKIAFLGIYPKQKLGIGFEMIGPRILSGLVDLGKEVFLWQKDFQSRYQLIHKDIVFLEEFVNYRGSILHAFQLETGQSLWQLDITDIGKYKQEWETEYQMGSLKKILGVYQQTLLVAISNHTILAIDITSGQIQQQWQDLNQKNIHEPGQACLIDNQAKIVGLEGASYWEIDLDTGTLTATDLSADFKNQQLRAISSGQFSVKENHLLFCSFFPIENEQKEVITLNKIAAFNTLTKQIDWSYSFDFPKGVQLKSPAPLFWENHLFALDSSGVLHLFQNES